MWTEYVLSVISGNHKDAEPIRVLIVRLIELEKLLENKLEAQNMLEQTSGTYSCEINTNT